MNVTVVSNPTRPIGRKDLEACTARLQENLKSGEGYLPTPYDDTLSLSNGTSHREALLEANQEFRNKLAANPGRNSSELKSWGFLKEQLYTGASLAFSAVATVSTVVALASLHEPAVFSETVPTALTAAAPLIGIGGALTMLASLKLARHFGDKSHEQRQFSSQVDDWTDRLSPEKTKEQMVLNFP